MSANPITMASLLAFTTADKIVIGSDYPFVPEPGLKNMFAELKNMPELDSVALEKIYKGNALKLFSNWKR
ncbi:amidohydrolase family protein [Pseudomaricurvus hydrocarbonicus]